MVLAAVGKMEGGEVMQVRPGSAMLLKPSLAHLVISMSDSAVGGFPVYEVHSSDRKRMSRRLVVGGIYWKRRPGKEL